MAFRALQWCHPMLGWHNQNKLLCPDDHLIWCSKLDSGPRTLCWWKIWIVIRLSKNHANFSKDIQKILSPGNAMLISGADLKERAKMHPSEVGPFVAQLRAGNSTNYYFLIFEETRMHSSGIRTARLLTVSQHALRRGGVSQHALGRGVCIPACTGQGVYPSMHCEGGCVSQHAMGQTPPWTDRHL